LCKISLLLFWLGLLIEVYKNDLKLIMFRINIFGKTSDETEGQKTWEYLFTILFI
jgi:hypothetical protein